MLTKVLSLGHKTNTHKKTHDAGQLKQNLKEKKKTKNPENKEPHKKGERSEMENPKTKIKQKKKQKDEGEI